MVSETTDNPNVRTFIKGSGAPSPMRRRPRGARAGALLFAALLILTMLPTVQASYTITMSASPMAMEINPGENGTYSITVHNTGDEDLIVQLSTSQDSGCQGYTSTIEQITGTIEAGTSEEAELTVALASNAEDDCETTVSGTANAVPPGGSPETADVVVTTTAGSGSGGAVTGVSLSASVT